MNQFKLTQSFLAIKFHINNNFIREKFTLIVSSRSTFFEGHFSIFQKSFLVIVVAGGADVASSKDVIANIYGIELDCSIEPNAASPAPNGILLEIECIKKLKRVKKLKYWRNSMFLLIGIRNRLSYFNICFFAIKILISTNPLLLKYIFSAPVEIFYKRG